MVPGESPFYLYKDQICYIKNCRKCEVPNRYIEYSQEVSAAGGKCTCPDGSVYQVGVYEGKINDLACINGMSDNKIYKDPGEWSHKKVVCSNVSYSGFEYSEKSIFSYYKYANDICSECQENFCFKPVGTLNDVEDPYLNTLCTSLELFKGKTQWEIDYFRAEKDALLVEDANRV